MEPAELAGVSVWREVTVGWGGRLGPKNIRSEVARRVLTVVGIRLLGVSTAMTAWWWWSHRAVTDRYVRISWVEGEGPDEVE